MSELEAIDRQREARRHLPRHRWLAFNQAMRSMFHDDDVRSGTNSHANTIDETRLGRSRSHEADRKVVHFVRSAS